jgi:hypothetical protein
MRGTLLIVALVAACGPSNKSGNGTVDANGGGGDGPADAQGTTGLDGSNLMTSVYAHTSDTLFRVDPDTFAVTQIAPFGWPAAVGSDQMTDIAVDKNGMMIGVSYTRVYRVDTTTAQATLLSSSLQGMFNGLSFVPAAQVGGTGDDVLVGSRNTDGKIFRIDTTTGAATQVGDMGHGYTSSGDIVSVVGLGTVATVTTGSGNDILVKLAPNTFDATPIGTDTGFSQLWGIGFWKDKVFGFSDDGSFVLIDKNTGVGTLQQASGQAWWGAAVTTLAPVIN